MTNKPLPKFWNVARNSDGTGTIEIYGELTSLRKPQWIEDVLTRNYYASNDFERDIALCRDLDNITVKINSCGGDLYMGIAIHNALKSLKGKVTTVIEGVAASAASIIFCAGDERLVFPGSILMIHGVSSLVEIYGYLNIHDVEEQIKELKRLRDAQEVLNSSIVNTYVDTTGGNKENLLKMIDGSSEYYMSGEDAIMEGFATGYVKTGTFKQLRMVACAGKTKLYSGSMLLSDNFSIPANAAELGIKTETENMDNMINIEDQPEEWLPAAPAAPPAGNSEEAIKAAVAADRKRMAEIEALASKLGQAVDRELVNLAKFGNDETEPLSPEAFARKAIENFKPANFMEVRREELSPANDVKISAPPVIEKSGKGDLHPAVAAFISKNAK